MFTQTVLIAVPLILAALAGVMSERAGVVNMALEAMLIVGAFAGAIAAQASGSWAIGALAGVGAGVVVAAALAGLTVRLGTDQIIAGLALTLFAEGLTQLGAKLYWVADAPRHLPALPRWELTGVPLVDGFLGRPFVVGAAILVVGSVLLHERTVLGLRWRAVGEHPAALETVGLSVRGLRTLAVLGSGALAGLGGAYLALNVGQFQPGMSAGKGYIALAAVVFGRWTTLGAAGACLVFAGSEALAAAAERSQLPIPRELMTTLPYVLTLVAMAGLIGRGRSPSALGRPYAGAA